MSELVEAIKDNQLFMLYQPQMTANGTTIASVEALVRWLHPARGVLPPTEFIAEAERTGAIELLGEWVLRQACRDGARWDRISVAVNVSPLQFRSPHLVDRVLEIAKAEAMPLNRLELEITESAYFDEPERAVQELKRLRSFGIRTALDDFGTGFSSLSYLRRMPFDKIKIDKSFVEEVDTVGSASIVHAIVALARALGLKVTAEGVETTDHHRFLRAAGCHYLQGYLFSRPVPAAEITRMLAAEKAA